MVDRQCSLRNLVNKGKWSSDLWEGDSAQASGIESSGSDKADWVDLFVFSGHGPYDATDGSGTMHFRTNHTGEQALACNVQHSECSWGQGDCEFVVDYSCNFLNDCNDTTVLNSIKMMCQGVHMVCGFSNRMRVYPQGATFGCYLMGYNRWKREERKTPKTVKQAWFDSTDDWQDRIDGDAVIATVVCHTSTEGDYMPGNWKWSSGCGMASDPPPCTSSNLSSYVRRNHASTK